MQTIARTGCVCPSRSSINKNKWMRMWQRKRVGDWAEIILSTLMESLEMISQEHPSVAARSLNSKWILMAVSHPCISIKFVMQKWRKKKLMRNTFIGANGAAWKQTANRLRVSETQEQMVRKATALQSTSKWTSEIPAERCKQTHVHGTYLHQSYQRHHGCNILPQLHLLLPGSTNSHSGLLCISAYSLNTWLASGEERWNRADEEKTISAGKSSGSVWVCVQAAAGLGPSDKWRWGNRL